MDKLSKFLKRLTKKERKHVGNVLTRILSGNATALDIKKLKGVADIYRVRAGNVRIIFRKEKSDIRVLDISRRDDNTYRDV